MESRTSLFLYLVTCCLPMILSWKMQNFTPNLNPRTLKNVIATSVVGWTISQPSITHAAKPAAYSPQTVHAIENVERVSNALKFIGDDLSQKEDVSDIISQIKFLQKTYQLKENVQLSVDSAVPKAQREEARRHGQNAVEDLALVYEYFEDEVDNFTGMRKPPRDALVFANEAVAAAQRELKDLIALYPADIRQTVESKLTAELGN